MTSSCGCCGGSCCSHSEVLNRPGLAKIDFRLGGHDWFKKAMLERLSATDLPELAGLRSRDTSDFTIAYFDACALAADVLCFYQERIANESYLQTATERRSLVELSRLVGYAPKPGVSASTYLSYTIDKESASVVVPAGSKVNSVPDPGQDMVTFETSEPLTARAEWNAIKPRQVRPQTVSSLFVDGIYIKGTSSNLKVTDRLLLKFGEAPHTFFLARIDSVQEVSEQAYTIVRFTLVPGQAIDAHIVKVCQGILSHLPHSATDDISRLAEEAKALKPELARKFMMYALEMLHPDKNLTRSERKLSNALYAAAQALDMAGVVRRQAKPRKFDAKLMLAPLLQPATMPPAASKELLRDVRDSFKAHSELNTRLLTNAQVRLSDDLYSAWQSLPPLNPLTFEVVALRTVARPFGHNAPLHMYDVDDHKKIPLWKEWEIEDPLGMGAEVEGAVHHEPDLLFLDSSYEVSASDYFAVEIPPTGDAASPPLVLDQQQGLMVNAGTIAGYGLTGKTVAIKWRLNGEKTNTWAASHLGDDKYHYHEFRLIRGTTIFAGHDRLELASMPVEECVGGTEIELDRLYDGLDSGRWIVVSGERADVEDSSGNPIPGVMASELAMISGSQQTIGEAEGETFRTTLRIEATRQDGKPGLQYCYKRSTATINANVGKATHGETRTEILGSGNAARAWQKFELKQAPLTYVSSDTVTGMASSLEVQVNGVAWHERDSLASQGSRSRAFFVRHDDEQRTTVSFGDGHHGQRLPTGRENIKAIYRSGLGRSGNLKPGKLTLLASRPLGVKDVNNPVRSSGGADPETIGSIRSNAPLAVLALDRLVGIDDYEFFSRTFAGVSKAAAKFVSAPGSSIVQVTICGDGDDPVEPGSDLMRNLLKALVAYGDPDLPVRLVARNKLILLLVANVRLAADYRWENAELEIRATLLQAFGFESSQLGGSIYLSRVLAVMQALPCVDYVDIDRFDAVGEQSALDSFAAGTAIVPRRLERLDSNAIGNTQYSNQADAIAYFTPSVPDTIILREIKS